MVLGNHFYKFLSLIKGTAGIMPSEFGINSSQAPTPSTGFNCRVVRLSVSPTLFEWLLMTYCVLVAVLDNHRVLHGRSAFSGKRRMCGAYIGVDEYRSKLAVLREKFSPDLAPPSNTDVRSE